MDTCQGSSYDCTGKMALDLREIWKTSVTRCALKAQGKNAITVWGKVSTTLNEAFHGIDKHRDGKAVSTGVRRFLGGLFIAHHPRSPYLSKPVG